MNHQRTPINLWEFVKAVSTLAVVGVVVYKILITPMQLNIDFQALLSLFLALFSVALSTLFYFKATETSNTFYDNTYKFTKDIAELLIKIESGFGERLKHLDESYSSMKTYFENPSIDKPSHQKPTEELQIEQEAFRKAIDEREQIIQELFEKAQLQEDEKKQFKTKLEKKEEELSKLKTEITAIENVISSLPLGKDVPLPNYSEFTFRYVVDKISLKVIKGSSDSKIQRCFNAIIGELPREYIEDLVKDGFYDRTKQKLTPQGIHFLKYIATVYSK